MPFPWRSASPSSTTTAPSGPRSRCRPSCTTSCSGGRLRRRPTRPSPRSSRTRPSPAETSRWLGAAVDKHYAGDDSDLHAIVGAVIAATENESVEDYAASVAEFYRDALHPVLERSRTRAWSTNRWSSCCAHLEANGFTCYIVSGGDRDFMRPMTVDNYGIPPERVIGSAVGLVYDAETNDVRYGASFDFLADGPESSPCASGPASVAVPSSPQATRTATCRCCATPTAAPPASRCSCTRRRHRPR